MTATGAIKGTGPDSSTGAEVLAAMAVATGAVVVAVVPFLGRRWEMDVLFVFVFVGSRQRVRWCGIVTHDSSREMKVTTR